LFIGKYIDTQNHDQQCSDLLAARQQPDIILKNNITHLMKNLTNFWTNIKKTAKRHDSY